MSALAKQFPNGCRWGVDAHNGIFQNRIFGNSELGACISNLATSRGGDGSTVNVAGYEKKSGQFRSGWGPSWRCVWPMKADATAAGPAGASADCVDAVDVYSAMCRELHLPTRSRRQHFQCLLRQLVGALVQWPVFGCLHGAVADRPNSRCPAQELRHCAPRDFPRNLSAAIMKSVRLPKSKIDQDGAVDTAK